ncbi:hypothetical protein CLV47_12358, partial [Antricoccus suffuscus]
TQRRGHTIDTDDADLIAVAADFGLRVF